MKLTEKEAREVIWQDSSDWKKKAEWLVDHSRWSVVYAEVHEHLPTGRCYKFVFGRGATEMQDESPFEYEKEVVPTEVEWKEVTEMQWIEKK